MSQSQARRAGASAARSLKFQAQACPGQPECRNPARLTHSGQDPSQAATRSLARAVRLRPRLGRRDRRGPPARAAVKRRALSRRHRDPARAAGGPGRQSLSAAGHWHSGPRPVTPGGSVTVGDSDQDSKLRRSEPETG
jgi:hypothetical protein